VKLIDCRTKKHPNAFSIVDDEDFEYLNQYTWSLDGRGYPKRAIAGTGGRTVFMHRELMKVTEFGREKIIDHINGDPLDNRRGNLRICTSVENARNKRTIAGKDAPKGAYWHKRDKKWNSRIWDGKRNLHLGTFDTAEEAHAAYCAAALEMYGEFANFGDRAPEYTDGKMADLLGEIQREAA
jgi:hypothetical protein